MSYISIFPNFLYSVPSVNTKTVYEPNNQTHSQKRAKKVSIIYYIFTRIVNFFNRKEKRDSFSEGFSQYVETSFFAESGFVRCETGQNMII